MKSRTAASFSHGGSSASRRPLVRLLGLAPASLLLCGLFTVWAGPLAAPVAAAAPTGVVVAWGDDSSGQTTVPSGLSGVTAIAAGCEHTLVLKSNGTVVAWGRNDDGQTTVPSGLSGVTAIAAGCSDSLALKSNGTVVAWGSNPYGETDVPAGLSGVTAIAAGAYHSLALKSDGTVVAWGYNFAGQATVPAGLSGVSAIAAGQYRSLALKSGGTVVGWGGTTVPAGLSGVTGIAAGGWHDLALKSDGTVIAWGNDTSGQTDVPPGLSGVTAIAAGGGFSLALKPSAAATLTVSGIASSYVAGAAHSVTVTARDASGNVATGYRGKGHFSSSDPLAVLPADYTFTAADNGVHRFSLGLTLKTAGTHSVTATDTVASSITGVQSGIVVIPAAATTLAVSGLPSPYAAGAAHSVTVTAKDPYGNTVTAYRGKVHFTSSDPAAVLPANYTFTASDGGVGEFSHALALETVGNQWVRATDTVTAAISGAQTGIVVAAAAGPTSVVVAWGNDTNGQTDLPAGLSGVAAISPGLALVAPGDDGTVTAWGGQPTVPAGLSGVTAISAGGGHDLALKSDGTVVAWGGNYSGQATVPAGLSGITAIAAGGGHSLALKSDGTVVAWGNDSCGPDRGGQTEVPAGLSGVIAIAAGGCHSLALKSDGTVVAWGGYDADLELAFVPTGLSGVTAIAAAGNLDLALKSDGTVVAWGGYDVYADTSVPAGLSGVTAIAAGGQHSLALKSDGTVVAWGENSSGQIAVPNGLSGVTAIAAGWDFSLALEPSVAASLAVSGIASPYASGAAHSVTVTAKDAAGTVATGYRGTVHFTSSDPLAVLPADYTFTAADAGVRAFSYTLNPGLVLKTAGSQWVRATDKLVSSIAGVQSGIVVTPLGATTLAVSGLASPRTAGVAGSLTVTARDAYGNTATGYTGTVHFTSSDGAAVLPANATLSAGVGTFSVTLRTAGTQSVTATDTVTASIAGLESGVVVTPGAATTLFMSGIGSPAVAGVSQSVTVTAKDAYGTTATGYRGTIHFTSTDTKAVLPADYTFTAGDAGTHTFSITLKTAGSQGIRATDTVTSTITGAKYGIVVTPGAAKTLAVSGIASPYVAGVAHSVTVTALDAYGNTATGYRGTVGFTSTDAKATLPANYTFTAADSGVHRFSVAVTLKSAGNESVRARDTVTSTITGGQYPIVVTAAAATTLTVSGLASPRTHGTAGTITVTAHDAYGNVAIGYRGTVTFTSTDSHALLPANYTFTAANAGTHTFSVTLKNVGTQAVRARDTVTATITGLQGGIVVT